MPNIGSCADITCDDELKELYECHCCSDLVCLYHLNVHIETRKKNKQQPDSIRNDLKIVMNSLKLIVEEKLEIIEREQNLIEQAKKLLDASNSSIDDLQNIFKEIHQRIELNHSEENAMKVESSLPETKYRSFVCESDKKNVNSNDITDELEISNNDEHPTSINLDFIDIASFDETVESFQDEHVNEIEDEVKLTSYREVVDKCPLTFDGAYGLTKANHSIKFCEYETTRQLQLYLHFIFKHRIKKIYAQRLVQAVADNQDPWKTKLFKEDEDIVNHFYEVPCPFFNGRINSLEFSQRNVTTPPCRYRLVTFHRLAHHLQSTHKISRSSAQKFVDDFKKKSNKK